MIAEQYINEAKRIRQEYLKNLSQILTQEPKVEERKKEGLRIQEEISDIINSDLNEVKKILELNNRLLILEKEIVSIQNIVRPYSENIEKLRGDSDRLFLAIKEKYPNIDDKDIEEEIMSHIEE
jgi:hypothetical protein